MKQEILYAAMLGLVVWSLGQEKPAMGQTRAPRSGVVDMGAPSSPGAFIIGPRSTPTHPFGTDVRANQDTGTAAQNETTIAANPTNPNNLVGGANDYRGPDSACGFYSSIDGGLTWRPDGTLPVGAFGAGGDPAVAFDRNGNVYYACLRFNRSTNANDIAVAKSTNGGLTYSAPVTVVSGANGNDFNDKEYIAVDTTAGAFSGRVYVTWTHFSATDAQIRRYFSADGGATWAAPLTISDTQNNQGSIPAVGPNGEVYVVWEDFNVDRLHIDKSTDGGISFGTDVTVSSIIPIPDPLPGFSFRTNSFPTLAVDTTNGACRGNVYVAWADFRNGNADIFFSRSTNGGAAWSAATRIDHAPGSAHSFFPAMTVDPQGTVHIVYYDNRVTSNRLDVFASRSADCGNTFTPSDTFSPGSDDRVTDTSFDPALDGFSGQFIGDYIGVTATGQFVHPLFMSTALRGNADAVTDRTTAGTLPGGVVCDMQLNKTNFVNGDSVIAQVLRIANPGTVEVPVELKIWFDIPGMAPASFANTGANGSVKLPPGFTTNAGPLTLFTVSTAFPRGTYGFNCRLLNPVTGGLLTEDLNPFQIQ